MNLNYEQKRMFLDVYANLYVEVMKNSSQVNRIPQEQRSEFFNEYLPEYINNFQSISECDELFQKIYDYIKFLAHDIAYNADDVTVDMFLIDKAE